MWSLTSVSSRQKKGNKDIKLSAKEFEILKFLAENEGKVISREELLREVWGYKKRQCLTRARSITTF